MEKYYVLDRIEQLLKEKHMSHYELAKRSGLHQSSISVIFRRRSIPSVFTLDKICEGMGMTLAEFFSEGEGRANLTESQRNLLETIESFSEEDQQRVMRMFQVIEANYEKKKDAIKAKILANRAKASKAAKAKAAKAQAEAEAKAQAEAQAQATKTPAAKAPAAKTPAQATKAPAQATKAPVAQAPAAKNPTK